MIVSGDSREPQRHVASRLQLPQGSWATVFDALCALFPAIAPQQWRDRIARGRVLDAQGQPIAIDTVYRVGAAIRYFREVANEPEIFAHEAVLYADENIVVADKPHGLPVMPAGRFVNETLLTRLMRRFDNADLVPLHRIDRDTAGLVLFSVDRHTRPVYAGLFLDRAIAKRYEAWAPALPDLEFPYVHCSRLVPGDPFFRMQQVDGSANSETHIDVIERGATLWRYALNPVSGRKHQLRVHMAALGAPIVNDPFYPELRVSIGDGLSHPLQLLARSLSFIDPISAENRRFDSRFELTG
jgi:tRNA pseudouridine32 synthase / 23S rRNA pseudouridine746 synthase